MNLTQDNNLTDENTYSNSTDNLTENDNLTEEDTDFNSTDNSTQNTINTQNNAQNSTDTDVDNSTAAAGDAAGSPVIAYWIRGDDFVNLADPTTIKNNGITDVFISAWRYSSDYDYYTVLTNPKVALLVNYGIRVHAWITCFKDSNGNWVDPSNTDFQNILLDQISDITSIDGISGIHLDYVRYPGTTGHTAGTGGAQTITDFVAAVRSITSGKILSAALMPDENSAGTIYGQNYGDLSNYLDWLVPMVYKGNYQEDTAWIGEKTTALAGRTNKPLIVGLQTYVSDSDTSPIPISELQNDINEALSHGAAGVALFRYGLANLIGINITQGIDPNTILITYRNTQTDSNSTNPYVTPDGRYVVFESDASNIVLNDTNGVSDIFVYDRWTGITIRISTATDGSQANGASRNASITPNGRYIVFESLATNLVSGDTNYSWDIFVKDGWTGAITRVSTSASGAQSNGASSCASITSDGRYVSFESDGNTLVSGDTNGVRDVFVKDSKTGQITRVSTSATGIQANGASYGASITSNGRYISFTSDATNLVSGDTNGASDVFVKDGWTGSIVRVSTSANGGQANGASKNASITSDGRYIAFESLATNLVSGDSNGFSDVFVKDGWTGQITRVSTSANGGQSNGASRNASITPNGRYIAFESDANNLVSGDTNNSCDVFVKDGWTGSIVRVSTSATGTQANGASRNASITPDGRYIVFESDATNLISDDSNAVTDVFLKNGWTGALTKESRGSNCIEANGNSSNASITSNGRYVVFESNATNLVSGDTNGATDIFVRDSWTGSIVRVSTSASGGQANGASRNASITSDGRYIVFESIASNLVTGDTNSAWDVFVKDGWTGAITRISTALNGTQGNSGSYNATITSDGRYIAFSSDATNLISGDTNGKTDVFVKDGWTGSIVRVSTSATGTQANGASRNASITPNGRYIAFESDATNLVSGDSNGLTDVFVKDGWTGSIVRVSTNATGTQTTGGGSFDPVITPDGRYIVFESDATNLVSGDTNVCRDLFVKDGWTGAITRVSTSASGGQANGASRNASITPNGRYVVFESDATNLIYGDTNGSSDVFWKDGWTGEILKVSTNVDGSQSDGNSYNPSITSDGRYVVFHSETNLTSGCNNNGLDVFVRDMGTRSKVQLSGMFYCDPSMQPYIQATSNCQSNDPTIIAKAMSLVQNSGSAYEGAEAIFEFVRDEIGYSFYYNTIYGALGTLNKGTGNCCDTAHLVVALARAVGIPARYMHGTCTFSSGTYGHVWAQLYVNGQWVNADATSTRNSLGVINNWNTSTYIYKGCYIELPF